MNIIIIGAGKIGYSLAMHLALENNNVTVIDKNTKALAKLESSLDVLPLKGNGISTSTLLEAGCAGVDLIIAVTGSDEINMLSCLTAKKLGALRTIARIRDPQYAKELLLIKDDLGLDMVINPEESAADEIGRILTIPGILQLENFAKGRVHMVEVSIKENMPLANMKLKHISKKLNVSILIGAIIRDGKLLIPHGDFVVEPNDSIYVIGRAATIYSFCKTLYEQPHKVKNVMIVGGGKITYYLAKLLHEMHIKVKIVEIQESVCLNLAEVLPNALIINGDGTDSTLLKEEHFEAVDSFIALTGRDEENIIASLIAKQNNVKHVITKISKPHSTPILSGLGIDKVIIPQDIITDRILKYVRGHAIESLHRILGGQGEVIEFIACKEDSIIGIPLQKLHLIPDLLIATIVRKHEVVIPNGNDVIKVGDRVLIITTKNISSLNDISKSTVGGLTSELKNSIKKLGNGINL